MRHVMYSFYTSDIIGGVPGAVMWKDAIDAACIKIGDYHGVDMPEWDANIAFAAKCSRQGLPIEAWAYVWGEGGGEAAYLRAQYAKLLDALKAEYGADPHPRPRFILDAEAEYERNVSVGFLDSIGALFGDVDLQSTVIPMLPYRNRLALAVLENFGPVCPMLYWRDFDPFYQDWNNLVPDWVGGPFGRGWVRGFTEAAVSFYGRVVAPTLDELRAFLGVLEARGVQTVYYWEWAGAPEAWWLWLRSQKAPAPATTAALAATAGHVMGTTVADRLATRRPSAGRRAPRGGSAGSGSAGTGLPALPERSET